MNENYLAAAALRGWVNTRALGDPKTSEFFRDCGVNSNSIHEHLHSQSHPNITENIQVNICGAKIHDTR